AGDAQTNEIGPGRNLDKQRAAASAAKRPGDLVAGVGFCDVTVYRALGDPKLSDRHAHRGDVGAAARALAVAALALQRQYPFARTLVAHRPAQTAAHLHLSHRASARCTNRDGIAVWRELHVSHPSRRALRALLRMRFSQPRERLASC